MKNTKQIKCPVAGCTWMGHVVVGHVHDVHNISFKELRTKYPKADLASPLGWSELRHQVNQKGVDLDMNAKAENVIHMHARKSAEKKMCDVFDDKEFAEDEMEIRVFTDGTDYVPTLDENYVFAPKPTSMLVAALTLEKRNKVWLSGHSGTGKTQLVHNVAAKLGYELFRLNGDAEITRSHMLGERVVRDNEIVFQYGIVPLAMKRGGLLLIDEIDMLSGHVMATLRSVLEDNGKLTLLENGGEVITPHEDFRVVATANTFGFGDVSGLYTHTHALSEADRQRFSIFIKVDYMAEDREKEMLGRLFEDLTEQEVKGFLQVTTSIRTKQKNGEIDTSFSPRQLINWVEKYLLFGNDVKASAEFCFLNSYPDDIRISIGSLIDQAFPATTVKP